MNKNEFIAAVSDNSNLEKFNLPKNVVASVVEAVLKTVETALQNGDEVRLVGFGNFFVAKRAAGPGRNPRTGEALALKASKTPRFRAGKVLKDLVNDLGQKK